MVSSKFAIVDIETTGGNSSSGKITEISIFLHNGTEIIDEFTTLINPERTIPHYITNLTGITDAMVATAPTFPQIAKRIVEITSDAFFVAHNVSFDYNFIKAEFASLGYEFERKTICTITSSRRLIPGHKSYSLGNLCADLGIHISDRHRARGDAFATVKLFEMCLALGLSPKLFEEQPLTPKPKKFATLFETKLLTDIPAKAGVYYFYDADKNLIYIGKSKSLKQRISSHFTVTNNSKGGKIKNNTASFDYTLTGSELIALLLESEEIKANKPTQNKAQRKAKERIGLFASLDNDIFRLSLNPLVDEKELAYATFDSLKEAKTWFTAFIQHHQLCLNYTLEQNDGKPCFNNGIKLCNGICCGAETVEEYNQRVQKAVDTLGFFAPNAIIVDHGRNVNEYSIVVIEENQFKGFGWIGKDVATSSLEEIKEQLYSRKPNADAKVLINGYLKKNKVLKIIRF